MPNTNTLTAITALDRLDTALDQFHPPPGDPLAGAVIAEIDRGENRTVSEHDAAEALSRIYAMCARVGDGPFHAFVVGTIEAQRSGRPPPALLADIPMAAPPAP